MDARDDLYAPPKSDPTPEARIGDGYRFSGVVGIAVTAVAMTMIRAAVRNQDELVGRATGGRLA